MGILHKNTPSAGLGSPAAAAETAVYTTPLISAGAAVAAGQLPVSIAGTLNITPGAAATGATVRVRQGNGVGGALVGASPLHTVAAGAAQSISYGATDASGFLQSPGQYTITVQMTAATGASTSNMLDVEVSE